MATKKSNKNPVQKNLWKFNKPKRFKDKKKESKKRGWSEAESN